VAFLARKLVRDGKRPVTGHRGIAMGLFVILIAGSPVRSPGNTVSTSALNKLRPVHAVALGGAGVAIGYDPEMVWMNPVAATGLKKPSLAIAGGQGRFEETTGQGVFCGDFGLANYCAGLAYYDAGTVTANKPDGGTVRFNAQRDILGILGVSGFAVPGIAIGLIVKVAQSELADEFATMTVAADAGFQARLGDSGIKLGGAVRNIGPGIIYHFDKAPSPVEMVCGLAYGRGLGLMHDRSGRAQDFAVLVADADYSMGRDVWTFAAGTEYRIGRIVALRGGYRLGTRGALSCPTAGLGIALVRNSLVLGLNYGIELNPGYFQTGHTVSISVSW